jgi:S-formylglutathione hydrolase FrmB
MVRKTKQPHGRVERFFIESAALAGNPLGDDPRRAVDVYLPAGQDGAGLPLLVDIVGFTGSGLAHTNWVGFRENVPERLDRLIAADAMPGVAVAFPDCFTRLGGNQYINSAGVGRWADFLLSEMLPEVERRYGCGGQGKRGVFGKSSGGYGAITHALDHADIWSAAACMSGDMAFELCYLPDMPQTLRALARCGLSIEQWFHAFEAKLKPDNADLHVINVLAMAAFYDPDPEAFLHIRLPVDMSTCEIIEERWANWLAHDPLTKLPHRIDALKSLKGLYIDCGVDDQYNLVYGARRFTRALQAHGVAHVYEEYPDDHTGVDYRLDRALPFLAKALT